VDSQTYRAERERECREVSASCDQLTVALEHGTDPPRARLLGLAHLRDDAYVKMSEIVELHDDYVHRIKYSYFLQARGMEIGGYERDPLHDPAEHMHCTIRDGHVSGGEPTPEVSFKEAVGKAWAWLSDHGYG
jgi:hypothetical protein